MELQQVRLHSTGRNRFGNAVNLKSEANLGHPPSSKFNLSILRPKWTRNLRRGDGIATSQGVDERSPSLRRQNHENAVETPSHIQESHPPVSDPVRDEGDHGETTQQTHTTRSIVESSGIGDAASMEPSTGSGSMPSPYHYTSAFASNACEPLPSGTTELLDMARGKEAIQSAGQDQDTTEPESSRDAKDASKPEEREEAKQYVEHTATTAENITTSNPDAEVRRDWVKEYVWQILTHRLRGAERISGSVVVETELHGLQQILIVKCYGRAAARASEIQKLLSRVVLQDYTLAVRAESQSDTDLKFLAEPDSLDHARAGTTDQSSTRLIPDNGRGDQAHSSAVFAGANTHVSIGNNHSQLSARGQNYYFPNTSFGAVNSATQTEGGDVDDWFANTPYWNATSIPVDCLLPRVSQATTNTLCGALIRMMSWGHNQEPRPRVWTCGGIVTVNGVPYALTTGHTFVLSDFGKEQLDVKTTKPSVTDYILPGDSEDDSKENGQMYGTHNWQTLGRVYRYVVSMSDHVPANYDWLLIDIASEYVLPNLPAESCRSIDPMSRSNNPGSVSICTWRGSLQATLLPGSSFMILGESSFKAMKMSVHQPMGKSRLHVTALFTIELTEYSARRLWLLGLQRRRRARSSDSWQHRG
jgi:hypothetical protein